MKTPPSAPIARDEHLARQEPPRIVAAAQALYFRQGIGATAPEDVAAYLGLTPETVHKWFPGGKPALVAAVVAAYAGHIRDDFAQQNEQSSTAVEELLALREWLQREMGQVGGQFFHELQAHYPAAWHIWQDHSDGYLLTHIRNNLRWGMLQDLYRADLDVEFLAQLWQRQMSGFAVGNPAPGLEPGAVQRTLLEHFLAGIVTPAGAHVARRLQEAPPFY